VYDVCISDTADPSYAQHAMAGVLGGIGALAPHSRGLDADSRITLEVQGVLSDIVDAVAFENDRGPRSWSDAVQGLRKQKARDQAIRIQV